MAPSPSINFPVPLEHQARLQDERAACAHQPQPMWDFNPIERRWENTCVFCGIFLLKG